jgi:hypothetical protein
VKLLVVAVVISVGLALLEEIGHNRDVGIASVVEARKLESSFDRLQKGEVIAADVALHAVHAVVGVNDSGTWLVSGAVL